MTKLGVWAGDAGVRYSVCPSSAWSAARSIKHGTNLRKKTGKLNISFRAKGRKIMRGGLMEIIMETVNVSAKALRQVLDALIGEPHLIREIQATRNIHALTGDNPIEILLEQFNAAANRENQARVTGARPGYAGVTVWVGNDQATTVVTELEHKQSWIDPLPDIFKLALRKLKKARTCKIPD